MRAKPGEPAGERTALQAADTARAAPFQMPKSVWKRAESYPFQINLRLSIYISLMRAYRFRLYPSKAQEKKLIHHLWLEKNLWNSLLEKTKKKYDEDGKFYSKSELQLMVKNSGLHSQAAQAVAHRLYRALQAKIRAKNRGVKWGFPRFKSLERMKSIYYPQSGFLLGHKLKVSPFGEIPIVRHRLIKGQIKTLTIKREFSGKWFAVFIVEQEPQAVKANTGPVVGLDLGLNRLATLSNGQSIEHPHQFRKFEQMLAWVQRRLSRRRKGSHNRFKAKRKVALVHEKIANARNDFLHKAANGLLATYSQIAMEKLQITEMAEKGHGKGIHDAAWGMFTYMLCYKAASAGSEILFVNPKNTSQECSGCHSVVQKMLWERTHHCSACSLVLDRDVNAAVNILARATAGMAGSNACGEEITISSVNQEAAPFRVR